MLLFLCNCRQFWFLVSPFLVVKKAVSRLKMGLKLCPKVYGYRRICLIHTTVSHFSCDFRYVQASSTIFYEQKLLSEWSLEANIFHPQAVPPQKRSATTFQRACMHKLRYNQTTHSNVALPERTQTKRRPINMASTRYKNLISIQPSKLSVHKSELAL